jgi:hypothetical protein
MGLTLLSQRLLEIIFGLGSNVCWDQRNHAFVVATIDRLYKWRGPPEVRLDKATSDGQ